MDNLKMFEFRSADIPNAPHDVVISSVLDAVL
jgi:hypothetical protein